MPRTPDTGEALVTLARQAIAEALEIPFSDPPSADDPRLRETGASFVTLTLDGELRGCIGSVEAHRPLGEDVRVNAVGAALRDPRFPPLGRDEFGRVRVAVSVLSRLEPVSFDDEPGAAAALRPGTDGVVLECGGRRATFLPQVWGQVADPAGFLRALKHKAGLPEDFWSPEVRLYRYTVDKYEEGAPLGAGRWS